MRYPVVLSLALLATCCFFTIHKASSFGTINAINFFSLHQKNPFGKLFSKTILKSSSEVSFLRKVGKLKIGLNSVEGPMEIMQIRVFLKRSYEKTKANLQFIFTGFVAQFSKFLSSYILSLSRLSFYFLHPYKESNVSCFDDTANHQLSEGYSNKGIYL